MYQGHGFSINSGIGQNLPQIYSCDLFYFSFLTADCNVLLILIERLLVDASDFAPLKRLIIYYYMDCAAVDLSKVCTPGSPAPY